jgi:hypothetical protein
LSHCDDTGSAWCEKFKALSGFPISKSRLSESVELITTGQSQWVTRNLTEADKICKGHVLLLGHQVQVGQNPEWNKDHINNVEFHGWHKSQSTLRPKSDIKWVWELSRLHHVVSVSKAFALSGDERYATFAAESIKHWIDNNTPFTGPNWSCAMEVAIRAINLLWALAFISTSVVFTPDFIQVVSRSLLMHGVYIANNLERAKRVVNGRLLDINGNHYLSNIAGLLFIGCVFQDLPIGRKWRSFAYRELIKEVDLQIDEDGVNWEYSLNYHRLVSEIILACILQIEREGLPIPEVIRQKCLKMVEFVHHYRTPSGQVPLIRDIDNGRLCILGDQELLSHDHILGFGSVFFNQPHLLPADLPEDCFWYFARGVIRESAPAKRRHDSDSILFPKSGFAILKRSTFHAFVICCGKGMEGHCGHTHNDFLSFELEAFGTSFLTDSGSYVYTQDPAFRNRMRSTASHNTVLVENQEQNHFPVDQLFEIASNTSPRVEVWQNNNDYSLLKGAYDLECKAGKRVRHARTFFLEKHSGLFLIRDQIFGKSTVDLKTFFHFGENVNVALLEENSYLASKRGGPALMLKILPGAPFVFEKKEGWVSRSYAIKNSVSVLALRANVALPYEQWYAFSPQLSDETLDKDRNSHLTDLPSILKKLKNI